MDANEGLGRILSDRLFIKRKEDSEHNKENETHHENIPGVKQTGAHAKVPLASIENKQKSWREKTDMLSGDRRDAMAVKSSQEHGSGKNDVLVLENEYNMDAHHNQNTNTNGKAEDLEEEHKTSSYDFPQQTVLSGFYQSIDDEMKEVYKTKENIRKGKFSKLNEEMPITKDEETQFSKNIGAQLAGPEYPVTMNNIDDMHERDEIERPHVTFADDIQIKTIGENKKIKACIGEIEQIIDKNIGAAGTAEGYEEKLVVIEEEFQKMKNSQIKTIKLKSKIFQFIYSELYKIENEYKEKIRESNTLNEELKKENESLKLRIDNFESMNVNNSNRKSKLSAEMINANTDMINANMGREEEIKNLRIENVKLREENFNLKESFLKYELALKRKLEEYKIKVLDSIKEYKKKYK
ncbi:hypothetical protein ENBRE01_0121 [Enteropsectra breve]|nr:hypothetical protein ENBRE01_0121 [Enteropsectra breve]